MKMLMFWIDQFSFFLWKILWVHIIHFRFVLWFWSQKQYVIEPVFCGHIPKFPEMKKFLFLLFSKTYMQQNSNVLRWWKELTKDMFQVMEMRPDKGGGCETFAQVVAFVVSLLAGVNSIPRTEPPRSASLIRSDILPNHFLMIFFLLFLVCEKQVFVFFF